MLVRVMSDQICANWEPIRQAIEVSLPPVSPGAENRMDKILEALISGDMQCWMSADKEGNAEAVVTTSVVIDGISGTKSLLIFSLYGMDVNRVSWVEGLKGLARYAKSVGCDKVIAYSNVDSVINFMYKVGADIQYRLISLDLES